MIMEQKDGNQRQDIACSRCRERKTRCSRERPACSFCRNDDSECDYSLPEKRVNHLKLLCQNFERLESRLNSIESDLSWLTTTLKQGGAQRLIANAGGVQPTDKNVVKAENPQTQSSGHVHTAKKRRVIRNQDGQGGLHHGPGTLLSLCQELQDFMLSKEHGLQPAQEQVTALLNGRGEDASNEIGYSRRRNTQSTISVSDRSAELLERICIIASFATPSDVLEPDHAPVKLPPKQLLLMALPQFFSQIDYSTDIFMEAHFVAQVEVIYSQPLMPTDDAWAICFNTIILLVLGSDSWTRGNDGLMTSQFALPLFQAMRTALHQARLFTTPKLVNVQALALLSICAEKYYPAETSNAIFAQACLLSKRAGLHQIYTESDDFSQDEVREQFKTFVSLSMRDKTLAMTSSSICWLPSLDYSISIQTLPSIFANPCTGARIQLAEIQEELYRHLSVETRQQSGEAVKDIASIRQKLSSWRNSHWQYILLSAPYHRAELQLTFLATRMIAYSSSRGGVHRSMVLDDARASCLILLLSYGKYDRARLEMVQSLLGRQESTSSILAVEHDPAKSANESSSTGHITSLFNAFPLVAFFELTKHIVRPQYAEETSANPDKILVDLELLREVHNCAAEVKSRMQSQNHMSQVERILEHILELIQLSGHGNVAADSPAQATSVSSLGLGLHTPASSSQGLGSEDFSAAATLAGTDLSWDFLSSPIPDPMLSMGSFPDGGEARRKRPRMTDADFSVGDDTIFSFLPMDWPTALN
ncbi:hypothetical protein GGR52DRAFT_388641 [Hypoxylon sp. FL1284]|nr:hypothetical protein GGR52DRAFT_388641 [Hypoxylon sp. FL1284]